MDDQTVLGVGETHPFTQSPVEQGVREQFVDNRHAASPLDAATAIRRGDDTFENIGRRDATECHGSASKGNSTCGRR